MLLLTKANTTNTLEGNRLQPRDTLDASRPTCVGHQPYVGAKGEPDGRSKQSQKSPERGAVRPFILKGHVTHACAAL